MTDWATAKTSAEAAVRVAGSALSAPYLVHINTLAKLGPVFDAALTGDVVPAREAWFSRYNTGLSRYTAAQREAVTAADRAARRAERLELDARSGLPTSALVRNGSTFILAPDVAVPNIEGPTRTATRTLNASGTPVFRLSSKLAGAIGNAITASIAHGAGTTFTLSVQFGAAYVETLALSGPGALVVSELVNAEWIGATRPDPSGFAPLSGGVGQVFDFVRERLQRVASLESTRPIQPVLNAALVALGAIPGPDSFLTNDRATQTLVAPYDTRPAATLALGPDGAILNVVPYAGPHRAPNVLSVRGMEDRLRSAIAALEPLVSAMTGAL